MWTVAPKSVWVGFTEVLVDVVLVLVRMVLVDELLVVLLAEDDEMAVAVVSLFPRESNVCSCAYRSIRGKDYLEALSLWALRLPTTPPTTAAITITTNATAATTIHIHFFLFGA